MVNQPKLLKTKGANKIVLVYFSTWCVPCWVGLKMLAKNKSRLKKAGIKVVLVDYKEEESAVKPYLKKMGLDSYLTVLDKFGLNARRYGVEKTGGSKNVGENASLPRTFVLDMGWRVLAIYGKEGKDYIDRMIKGE